MNLYKKEEQQIPQSPQIQEQIPTQQQLLEQSPNPFNVQQYENVNIPDVPISYSGGMSEQLLNDNEVPEEVKTKFWYIFHKDNTLTFLDEERLVVYSKYSVLFGSMSKGSSNSMPKYSGNWLNDGFHVNVSVAGT